jgi:hypothetical protein
LKFLGRAKKFLRELASEPEGKVQYFNVTCASGHRVRGERTEGYQALRCPACGEGVFVLPSSPLPEPPAPVRSSQSKGASRGKAWVDDGPVELTDPGRVALDVGEDEPGMADAEIIWDDPPPDATRGAGRNPAREQPAGAGRAPAEEAEPFWEEDLTRAAAASSAGTTERRQTPRDPGARADEGNTRPVSKRQPAAAAGPRRSKVKIAPAVAQIEVVTSRKKPSPLALILIFVPLLVITAAAWSYWRNLRQEYPLIAERGRSDGIPALDEGKFDKAYQLLAAAKSAVDSLGGAVAGADEIRTAAAEAAIFVDLIPRPLEEMLEDAGRPPLERWASTFNTLYKGRAILIDSIITNEPEAGPSSRYTIEYVVFPAGGANNFGDGKDARPDRFALIDLTGFQLFDLARPRKGDHVTFGARLASFRFDATNDVWWVGLEPDSGVYITHTKALDSIGLTGGASADLPAESQP